MFSTDDPAVGDGRPYRIGGANGGAENNRYWVTGVPYPNEGANATILVNTKLTGDFGLTYFQHDDLPPESNREDTVEWSLRACQSVWEKAHATIKSVQENKPDKARIHITGKLHGLREGSTCAPLLITKLILFADLEGKFPLQDMYRAKKPFEQGQRAVYLGENGFCAKAEDDGRTQYQYTETRKSASAVYTIVHSALEYRPLEPVEDLDLNVPMYKFEYSDGKNEQVRYFWESAV